MYLFSFFYPHNNMRHYLFFFRIPTIKKTIFKEIYVADRLGYIIAQKNASTQQKAPHTKGGWWALREN